MERLDRSIFWIGLIFWYKIVWYVTLVCSDVPSVMLIDEPKQLGDWIEHLFLILPRLIVKFPRNEHVLVHK